MQWRGKLSGVDIYLTFKLVHDVLVFVLAENGSALPKSAQRDSGKS